MIKLSCRITLISVCLILFFLIPVHAAVPVPSKVTDDIAEPQRTELSAQRKAIITRRDSIKLNVAIHNVRCGKVRPGSDIADECRTNQARLEAEISSYADDVIAFNTRVIEAPRAPDKPGPDALPGDNMAAYFLLQRDESYSIHNEIMRDMIADDPNVLEKEILRPLDLERISGLTLDQAARLVNDRQEARERQAARKASERMHETMKKLEREGIIKAGDNVIRKKKSDPEFRERFNSILSEITKAEIADIRKARSLALQEMETVIEARAVDPAKKNRLEQRKEAIQKRHDSALKAINDQSITFMFEELERLKQEGYYSEGDNLVEKDKNDPAFRNAVNEAVRNVLIRQYESGYREHRKALNDMRSAVKELFE